MCAFRVAPPCRVRPGPGKCIAIPKDLSTSDGVSGLVKEVTAAEGSLHILVNNSGVSWGAPFDKYPAEGTWWDCGCACAVFENAVPMRGHTCVLGLPFTPAFDRLFRLNVTAPFLLARDFAPLLKASSVPSDPARVINIGSIAGLMPQVRR